jgi:hypothetical protein
MHEEFFMRSRRRRLESLVFLVVAASGCASELSDHTSPSSAGASPDGPVTAPPPGSEVMPMAPPAAAEDDSGLEAGLTASPSISRVLALQDPAAAPDGVAVTSRMRRLTLGEYVRTAGSLLGIDASAATAEFPEELPTLDGYFALGSIGISERLEAELRTSAEDLAARFVADPAAYARVVGCATSAPDCRDQFIASFGRNAYRRPLTDTERQRFQTLFDSAGELIASGDAFRDGVRLVVEAALQSPKFFYRIERGSGVVDAAGERIDGYEAATRLSYLIWGQGPDTQLLDAAESGALATDEGILAEARRLVLDPAARERVADFHVRWLALDALPGASKDAAVFPEYGPELLASMRGEVERFVEDVTLNENGALITLLTAPYGYADARLASVYGLPGAFGEELVRVDYGPDAPRAGLLTQAGFLAGHNSSSDRTSPILRGVFVLRRLLCQPIPDPPPNAQSTEPPPSVEPIVTTRDYYAWKTSMGACQGCHGMINPVGFAFEDFDGIGRHRDSESGEPVDAAGTLSISGMELTFEGGKELAGALAMLPEAQACYARNWLRYALGRADTETDLRTLTRLRQALADPAYGVRDIMIEIAQSTAFSHISAVR